MRFTQMSNSNPQAYVYSNAGHANSVLLHKFRERGLAASEGADDSIGWFEWSAEPGAAIDDKEAWYQSNPSLGHTVHEDNIKDSLSDREDIFRTEILCQFVSMINPVISEAEWKKCKDDSFKLDREKDTALRRKRLEMTKKVQVQNNDLTTLNEENQRILTELQETLDSVEEQKSQIECQNAELITWKMENEKIGAELVEAMKQSEMARVIAENAKNEAENNLDLIQKKTQFELINNIVRVALYVIIGVGGITTGIYVYSMTIGMDTDIIGSTWSNMFGSLR